MNAPRNTSEALLNGAYDDLRRLARKKLRRECPEHTLQPTALVHEVYCRLQKQGEAVPWKGRDHFLAAAAEAMRRILVEHARRKLAAKRGGNYSRMSLESLAVELPMEPADLLDVHEALDGLADEDPLAAELVKLRIFGGFSHIDAATRLGLSKGKADRVWAYAKARLYTLMTPRRSNQASALSIALLDNADRPVQPHEYRLPRQTAEEDRMIRRQNH